MSKSECEQLWWEIYECDVCSVRKERVWPSPFFVGAEYFKRSNKVLFIGQNPGWHHYKVKRGTDCCKMFPDYDYIDIQKNLVSNYRQRFDLLMEAITWELRVDPIWRRLKESGLENVALRDIAYSNLVKCATKSDDALSTEMKKNCSKWIKQEIDVLRPAYVVFLGKMYDYYPVGLKKEIAIDSRFAGKYTMLFHPSGKFSGKRNFNPEMRMKIDEINKWFKSKNSCSM